MSVISAQPQYFPRVLLASMEYVVNLGVTHISAAVALQSRITQSVAPQPPAGS
jgi:hypothetical protein